MGRPQAANGDATLSRLVAKTRHAAEAWAPSATCVLALEHERSCSRQREAVYYLLTIDGTQDRVNAPTATPQATRNTDRAVNLEPSAARDAWSGK